MIINCLGINEKECELRVYADNPQLFTWKFDNALQLYTAHQILNEIGYKYPVSDVVRLLTRIKRTKMTQLTDANNFVSQFISDNFI